MADEDSIGTAADADDDAGASCGQGARMRILSSSVSRLFDKEQV